MKTLLVSSENPAAFKVFKNTLDSKKFKIVFWPYCQRKPRITKIKSCLNMIKNILDDTWLGCFVNAFFLKYLLSFIFVRNIKKKVDIIQGCMENIDISCVVVASDRSITNDLVMILWAKNNDVPVIVLEYAYSAGFEGAVKSRKKKIFIDYFGVSRFSMNGVRFYKPCHEFALNILGVAPTNPWVLGNGPSDSVVVGTEIEKKRMVRGGVSSSKIKVIGSVELDEVIARNKVSSCVDDKSCLVALPQYWEHGLLDKEKHFLVIEDFIRELSSEYKNVFVSLHPKMKNEDYSVLLAKNGATLLTEPLKYSMHLADTFIGTYTSTILWAAILNKKIILVDHANLNYKDFYPELNLKACKSNKELKAYIKRGDENRSLAKFLDYNYDGLAKTKINNFIDCYKRVI